MKKLFLGGILCIAALLFSVDGLFAQENQSKRKKSLADKGWTPNQNPTRYFFSPSAFNLKRGEGYYQNIYVDLSFINYGVTDWLSLGGGVELIGSLMSISHGDWFPLYALTPKVGFQVGKNWHVGGGFMGGIYEGGLSESERWASKLRGIGLAYGNATYGNPDYNVTFGVGFPISTEVEEFIPPVLMLNGTCRISQKVSLISENLIITRDQLAMGFTTLLGYGIRLTGETMSLDVGFYNNRLIAEFLIIGVPYIDFVYKFGKHT